MEGKNQQFVPKTCLEILTTLLQSSHRISNIFMKFIQLVNCCQKYDLHEMAEIDKDAVGFPVICHLVAREFTQVVLMF